VRAFTIVAAMTIGARVAAAPAAADRAVALVAPNSLVQFDTTTPASTTAPLPVTGLGPNETLRGIDVRPFDGRLYGVTVSTLSAFNSLITTYVIDPATGIATAVGVTAAGLAAAGDVPTGMDFQPAVDRIRYVNSNDENARLNPTNGALAGNDTDLTPAATTDIIASAYDQNVRNPINPAVPPIPPTTLDNIDRSGGGNLTMQGGIDGSMSPNNGVQTDLGSLGFVLNAAHDGGFDITPDGRGFAALSNLGTGQTGLYRIALAAGGGAATFIGPIGAGTTEVRSLAILPLDSDGDGRADATDNCPSAANPGQENLDGDGQGDACDGDQDGDGLSDAAESAIGTNPRSANSDGDALTDGADVCPAVAGATANGCPLASPPKAAPSTRITARPKSGTTRRATIRFSANQAGVIFECKLDGGGYRTCTSPRRLRNLKRGRHRFSVRAISRATALIDRTPATVTWTVRRKRT
jgi:hypothetical protein